MATDAPEDEDRRTEPARWRTWLPVVAAAAALLLVSQALWLWQTWPVRELLQPAATAGARR